MIEETLIEIGEEVLLTEEKILWKGEPDSNKIFNIKDIALIPITLIFFLSSLIWELNAIIMITNPSKLHQKHASIGLGFALAFFGVPFIAATFYLFIGRFITKKHDRINSIYLITNKRVIIMKKKNKKNIEKYISKLDKIDISVNKDGKGTIIFGEIDPITKFYGKTIIGELVKYPIEETPIFYDIDDVEKVYGLINNLRSDINNDCAKVD